MTIQRDSIWPQVQPHAWKWRQRTRPITGVLIHTTRGGQWYDGNTELGAYINWCRSANNFVPFPGGNYAGIANYGTGPNRIVECVPAKDYLAAWSSWPSDETKVSIEVAQSNLGQPIEPETITATVQLVRELSGEYGFPLTRAYPANDWAWTGLAGHEDTVQGKSQGKSDPGSAFWVPFMAALEDDMTPEEREEHRAILAILGGRDTVLKARDGGMNFLLGYAIEQADQNQLEAAVARLEAAGGNSVLRALRDELNALVS